MACLLLGMPNVVWGQTTFTLDTESIDDSDKDEVYFTIKDDKDNEFGFDITSDEELYFNSITLKNNTITKLVFPSVEQIKTALSVLKFGEDDYDWTTIDGFSWYSFNNDGSDGPTIDLDGYASLTKVVVPIEYADNDIIFSFENVSDETSLDFTITGESEDKIEYTLPDNISTFTLDKITGNPTFTLPEMAGLKLKVLDSEVSLDFSAADPKSIYINGGKVVLTGDDFLKTSNETSVDNICVQNLESFIVEGNTALTYDDDFEIPYWKDNRYYGRKFDKLETIKINSTYDEYNPDEEGSVHAGVELPGFMFHGCYKVTTLDLNSPGMTEIPGYSFCQNIAKTVILPPYLEIVGEGAFMKEQTKEHKSDQPESPNNTAKGYWKGINVFDNISMFEVKYWDEEAQAYKNGFPNTLTTLKENAFYSHRMYDCHIPSSVKYIGAWALAGYNAQETTEDYIFTFDEGCERPIIMGYNALCNSYDYDHYEIRVPQGSIEHFLHYDATVTENTGRTVNSEMVEGYDILYAVANNAVKPYVKFTTSTATAVDAEGNSAYKQTFWLPYACKPEKVERMVAERGPGFFKFKDGRQYDRPSFAFNIDATLKAYYVGGKFVETKAGVKYDKVVLSRIGSVKDEEGNVTVNDNADIIPANTPVMITSNATSERDGDKITDEYLVTFDLSSSELTASGITQKFVKKDKDGKVVKELTPTYPDEKKNENWLKAYTTLDGKDFMQPVLALRYSWNGKEDTNYTNFVLNSGVFCLLKESAEGDESYLSAGKAIMSMPAELYSRIKNDSGADAKGIQMVFENDEDVITGISEQSSSINDNPSSGWYNLQGQRVDRPQHGIFIRNGKKVVVK